MSKNKGVSGGTSMLTVLGIVFIVLKLVGVINWSWWWVTVPLWGGLALVSFIILVVFIYSAFFKNK